MEGREAKNFTGLKGGINVSVFHGISLVDLSLYMVLLFYFILVTPGPDELSTLITLVIIIMLKGLVIP